MPATVPSQTLLRAGDEVHYAVAAGAVPRRAVVVDPTPLRDVECHRAQLPRLDVGPGRYVRVRALNDDGSLNEEVYALRLTDNGGLLLPGRSILRADRVPAPGLSNDDEPGLGEMTMESDFGLPELPDAIELASDEAESLATRLPGGCYLTRFSPPGAAPSSYLWGTLRVHHGASSVTVSGDLYLQRVLPGDLDPHLREALSWPDPAASGGIPCFPRRDYRYYVRVTGVALSAARVQLDFEPHLYDHSTARWTSQGTRRCMLEPRRAPRGFIAETAYLEGDVVTSAGGVRGRLCTGFVSRYLRKATLEIDRVHASESPRNNGAGVDYRTVFHHAGWDVQARDSQSNVPEPSGESWSDAELHAAMLAQRDRTDHDREWRYHLLCVRRLDSTSRGIMYDAYGGDSNHVPREGAAIASHWMIPDTATWGSVRNQRFGTASSVYFRTAAHEISHAMGLYHPSGLGNHIMQATNVIAGNATAASPFPGNALWQHSAVDQKRLRHLPDHWVRPGGKAFGSPHASAPISVGDESESLIGLSLDVQPLLSSVPLGAPVRVRVRLQNRSDRALPAPSELSLKAGVLTGNVRGPGGAERGFQSLVLCMDEEPQVSTLEPGESLVADETLLRGADGALFDAPGLHEITVRADYAVSGVVLSLRGKGSVMVTPPVDAQHAEAARHVLDAKDLLLTLALGGDHLDAGIAALQVALDNPVLRPHYTVVEAKRLARPFFDRPADPHLAMQCLSDDSVLSEQERLRLQQLSDAADRRVTPTASATPRRDEGAPIASHAAL